MYLVFTVMEDADRNGLEYKTKNKKGSFISEGANLVFSFDGHDKLMVFLNLPDCDIRLFRYSEWKTSLK